MFSKNSLRAAVAVAVCAFTFSLVSQAEVSVGSKSARPLITQKIDENNLVTLKGNTRPEALRPGFDRGAVDASMQLDHMMLQLKRAPEQQKALDTLVDRLHKPGDANFHKWMTPAEFGETFGLAKSDIAAVTGWLQSHGFTVNSVYPNGMVIDFSGTAGQVRAAFHTEIHNVVNSKSEKHIANMSDPKIPAALSSAVAGVVSLTNFFPHKMISNPVVVIHHGDKSYKIPEDVFAAHKTELMGMIDAANSSGPHAEDTFTCPASVCGTALKLYGEVPADFNTIYNVNPLWTASTPINGTGQKIVLIEDENMMAADFTSFRSAFLPTTYTGALTQVHPPSTGTNNCTNPGGNSDESALDVEWAGAIAPNAAIELASCTDSTTTFGGLIAIQNLINTVGSPNIYSVSYGECEAATGASGVAAFNSAYEQAAAQGQSVFVSSGDSDAAVCDGNGASYSTLGISVNGWGSSPYNVSVGGTDFGDAYAGDVSTYWKSAKSTATDYYLSAKSYINEIPWNNACASQLIYLSQGYANGEAFCNSSAGANYVSTGGGSGGPSMVFSKPSFQSGFAGIQNDGVRDMPDISLFAANGIWDQLVIFCYSASAPCDYTNATDTVYNGAGGTSFASPQMAAIQALINEKTGEAQGDPNYILYALAKTAYGAGGSSTCNSSNGNAIGSSCVFQDVTQGDNDAPCMTGTPDCYSSNSADTYGVLSTSTTALDIAYPTTTGWDFATGIGTPNAANLVNAWAAYSNGAPTVSVTTSPSSVLAGSVVNWTAVVTGNGSYPTGTVAFSVSGTAGTIATINVPVVPASPTDCTTTCSSMATHAYTVPGATAAGTYTVTANYAAPNEQYTAASGTGTYNVATVATTSALSASPNPVAFGSPTTLTDVISWTTASAINPTGNVVFKSSLAQIGTFETLPLSSCTINLAGKTATCPYSWTATYGGVQTVTAAYSGDTVYTSSSATTSVTVTQRTTSTTLSINPSTVTDVAIGTTMTAVVTYTGGSLTGSVTFAGNNGLGTVGTISMGSCTNNAGAKTYTCVLSIPNAWDIYQNGTYTVTAAYSGDGGDAGSTSAGQTFTVAGEDADTVTVAASPTSSTYAAAQAVTFTVGSKGSAGSGHTTGTITLTNPTLGTLATITLPTGCTATSGIAYSCTVMGTIPAGTTAGAYTITASYSGDVNYLPATKTTTYTVNKATPTAAISAASGGFESTVTLSATDTGVTSGVAPTGTVTFTVNGVTVTGTPSCSGSGLVETCTEAYTLPAALVAGSYPTSAVFAADTNYTASNTATGTLTVNAIPDITFTSVSHNFGQVQVGTAAASYGLTATNTGMAAYTFAVNFTPSKGFTQTNNCPASLAVGAKCQIQFNFTPAATGPVSTTWSVTTSATTFSPSNGGTLSGSGTSQGGVSVTTNGHNFGSVATGTTSPTYGVELSNSTASAVTLTKGSVTAPFAAVTNCGATLAAGTSCELEFTFTPTATGTVQHVYALSASTTITAGGAALPNGGITLTGTGSASTVAPVRVR